MTASSNFGNVSSVLVASAFLPFLPMLPLHLHIQNLRYDISQLSISWDRMDREYLATPRRWQADDIARFMLFIGPISSAFDITTYLVMWHAFGADSVAGQSLFQSGWFVEGLLSQNLIVHPHREDSVPPEHRRAVGRAADLRDHGDRHRHPLQPARRSGRPATAAARLFPLARRHPACLLRPHPGGENRLQVPIRPLVVMRKPHKTATKASETGRHLTLRSRSTIRRRQ